MAVPPIHPNIITAMRLPMAPVAVALMVTESPWGFVAAAVVSIALELTDLLDGYIARKYEVVSDFGKLFDPFSDAFCRYTLFLGLYAVGVADLWMIIAIFYRDSSISFFRSVAAVRNVVLAARNSGKAKAVVQGVGTQICFLTLVLHAWYPEMGLADVPWWTMLVMTLFTVYSFFDYFVANIPLLRDAWNDVPVNK
jgi:CDP-diacylglycerol--glycerol-3-phosphate 3-phosphatidyltransferase